MIGSRIQRVLFGVIFIFTVGCASKIVPTTSPHPPTTVAQVKIYQKPPAEFELLGQVEAPFAGNERGDATKYFETLQAGAASLGANGLLLTAAGEDLATVTAAVNRAGINRAYYKVPVRIADGKARMAVAQAIFVIKE